MSRDKGGDGCPICGAVVQIHLQHKHRCSEKVLRAIDAAHRRGDDWSPPDGRTVGDRIAEGSKLLRLCGDSDE